MNLSKKQQEVIDRMRETGNPLCCLPGNLWTTDEIPPHVGEGVVPSWWCGTSTVTKLEAKRLIQPIVPRRSYRAQMFRLVD